MVDPDGETGPIQPFAGPDATVTATVKNTRSNKTITLELAVAAAGATGNNAPDSAEGRNAQGFFKVVPEDGVNTVSNGPVFCGEPAEDKNNDGDELDEGELAEETVPSANDDTIAQIPARHGDRLTITTENGSGQVELVVDGDGPEFSAITPDDNAVVRPSRLTFSFEVRDDDSGLRHDGESIISPDGDFDEINADKDQNLASEPLSVFPGTSVPANGKAADIKVNVRDDFTIRTAVSETYPIRPMDSDDISASGTWRMAGSRAGVAYSFTAGGAHKADKDNLYQLRARDRAGNWNASDAVLSTDDKEPFVFRVDDGDPVLGNARTGIAYDTVKNTEKVDRSYIALDFTMDALGDVDTDKITVVGHTIVGVILPTKAPRINRGEEPIGSAPASAPDPDAGENGPPTPLTAPAGEDNTVNGPQEVIDHILTTQVGCDPANPGDAIALNPEDTPPATPLADDERFCQWTKYHADLVTYTTAKTDYDTAKTAYDKYVADKKQYEEENPFFDINGDREADVDPRTRVYVELAEDLAADATPSVVVVGGAVLDLAGNTNESKTLTEKQVMDWIAPTLTVTVTGTENDRPVVNKDGSLTVDVRSDEDLNRRPVVYFVSLATDKVTDDKDKVTGYEYNIGTDVVTATSLAQQEDENHWTQKYKASSVTLSDFADGLVGVVVVGKDDSNGENVGATDGWAEHDHQEATPAPGATDDLDAEDMDDAGLLVEIDRKFNDGEKDDLGTVTPRSDEGGDEGGKETESANPFVKLEFGNEKKEYNLCPDGGCVQDEPAAEFKDSHSTVTITEITLDDANVIANLNRVDASSFSLITRDLAVDKYKVEYTAVDDAGNEFEGEFTFNVEERQPYEIAVQPGWNLISLPATPLEPAIEAVLANNQYISPVLGYQQGDWITAIREEDGTWRGRLETLDGGYGYWVHARTFESIETMLSEVDPAGTLPTVSVTAGWNLLGVLDIFQNDAGNPPGTVGDNGDEADNYFSSIPWKVAYTYATDRSLWVKTVPGVTAPTDKLQLNTGDDKDTLPYLNAEGEAVETEAEAAYVGVDEILNGDGYWVWSPTPSTLVP